MPIFKTYRVNQTSELSYWKWINDPCYFQTVIKPSLNLLSSWLFHKCCILSGLVHCCWMMRILSCGAHYISCLDEIVLVVGENLAWFCGIISESSCCVALGIDLLWIVVCSWGSEIVWRCCWYCSLFLLLKYLIKKT